jgi:tripartite-type tricarboxylate transporter receptor subunit TctC
MIVPFPAGGTTDVIARIMADRMRRPLGQPIIIENIGGADGSVGVGRTARPRPDGYTICLGIDGTFVLNAGFYSLPYDVLNDFVPISPLATGPTVLVGRKTMPAKDLSELIAWLKAHPNEASIGMNTLGFRLMAVRFQKQTGTQFTIVPYRAAGSLIGDLVAGQIDLAVGTLTTDPAARSRLAELGYEAFPREQQSPETLAALQRADAEKWWPIIKELGIKAE